MKFKLLGMLALPPLKILLNVKCFTNQQERWQSGRLRYLGKVVTGQLVPGFESPSLRQIIYSIPKSFKKQVTNLSHSDKVLIVRVIPQHL